MEDYSYRPLEPGQFRLLHILPAQSDESGLIECSLSHHDFNTDQTTSYTALSYTWGEAAGGQDIVVDGRRMYARPNLYASLRSLRHHDMSHYVWIDAICINQRDEDDVEKTAQLALMGQIYSNAATVAICLMTDDGGDVTAFVDTVEHFRRNYDYDTNTCRDRQPREIYQAVQWLARNPYFRRMWIVQENLLAADRILMCGTRRVSWFYVQCMIGESQGTVPDEHSQGDHSQLLRESGIEHISDLSPHGLKAKQEPPAPTLFNALVRYRQQQCFDPRDKVFGLLGLREMQKPRIQKVRQGGYTKDIRDLFFQMLEWFESSPALTARHQTQLQRYDLLQDTLVSMDQSAISCVPVNLERASSLPECRFEVKVGTVRSAHLPVILVEGNYKGRVSAIADLKNVDAVLSVCNGSSEEDLHDDNLKLLEKLQYEPRPGQLSVGYSKESEENALKHLQRPLKGLDESNLDSSRTPNSGWRRIESTAGGWGIAHPGVEVGDTVCTVIVGQTQNNTPICHSLVLREVSEGVFRVVSYALDHLGFATPNRQKPSHALVAPMPPRATKGDRQYNVHLALDPATAFQITAPAGLQTLGYGWRTTEEWGW